jgi:hypothetical protein
MPNKNKLKLGWSFWLPIPWGRALDHRVGTLDLLALPLAFTQSRLLDPGDFVKEAGARGVDLKVEYLQELHRRKFLVPFFQFLRRPRPGNAGAVGALREVGRMQGPHRAVRAAAADGRLIDPASERFIPWRRDGDPQRWGESDVYYSEHQLLGLEAIQRAVSAMTMTRTPSPDFVLTVNLQPALPEALEDMRRGRALAILLAALDSHYLPCILGVISGPDEWHAQDPEFDLDERLFPFAVTPEDVANAAEALVYRAHSIDPLGDWYELVGLAHPESWKALKKEARLAMDFRIAAEVLLRVLDDLGRPDLSRPPEATGRIAWAVLDERLPADAAALDGQLMSRGLSPHPSLLLALEGKTEMRLMPQVMAEIYGGPVPDRLVQCVFMDTVNRDLDLLVRHALAPRFGQQHKDFVILERPPTRILVAVDPEGRYSTPDKQEAERQKLARRLFESLPQAAQSTRAREDIDTLVTVTTWRTGSWEFANFTDTELARAILKIVDLPDHVTVANVRSRVAAVRAVALSANIEHAAAPWGKSVNKVRLADELWPVLERKVQRRLKNGTIERLPAGRVALTALQLALQTHRRSVGLRTGP